MNSSQSSMQLNGRVVTDKAALAKVGASILGIFGGKDGGIPVDGVRQFEASLKELGKRVEINIYNDAGHAFMNPNSKAGYRETDTKDAWGKIDAFFAKTLAAGSGAVAVEPIGKLTISWGEIKAKNGPDHDGNIPPKGKLINRIPKTPFFDGHSSH